ncbi:hypothetical protein [Dapis sp. BLCC M229]|uniref:hypothetical protein n=1 Tax=Dapis sp. BLCC M229 TaxID=3400188 RepID=UPI003CF667D3
MAKNSQRLDKSKNSKSINHIKENKLLELELDELESIVGGIPNRIPPRPPPNLES